MSIKFLRSALRWPGNKYALLKDIFEFVPNNFENYHEPFLGSGSVFLNMKFEGEIHLSDLNPSLINFYTQVQNNCYELIDLLKSKDNTANFFYEERHKTYHNPVEQAAQLYYLNRTCFNGIYRVNSAGIFNVPYGNREKLIVIDQENLMILNRKLQGVNLQCCDFNQSVGNIHEGDFVFLDPPYSASTTGKAFLMYNEKLFSWQDQLRLKQYCQHLIDTNASFIMTNLFNDDVASLFMDELNLTSHVIERYSRIGSKLLSRGKIKEYLFTNI